MKFILTNLFLLLLLITIVMVSKPTIADSANDTNTQTNTSGSNTNITGGYESTTTTTYEDGATNTTTSTSTTTSSSTGSDIPVNSANSPSYSAMSQDVCSMGVSGSVTTSIVGVSGGKHFVDENCERIKLAKVLQDFGMKVASVAILCQDRRVHEAMQSAGTPCPFDGKIGKDAQAMWDKYPELRPDYENHLKRTEIMAEVDAELLAQQKKEAARIAAEEAKKAEEEALKKAEEEAKLNEEVIIIIDSDPVAVHGE